MTKRPRRAFDPFTGEPAVLLPADKFDRVRAIFDDEPDAHRLNDPVSGRLFALVPMSRYERYMSLFEDDPSTESERTAMLREFGYRVGWDHPEMNVFDTPEHA